MTKPGKLSVFTPKVCWDFRDGAYVLERNTIKAWSNKTLVDPTPCYAHDKSLVRELLAQAAEAFPVGWPVSINILDRETTARTNGWAKTKDAHGKPPRSEGAITLAGKRIPPHPAVTRYLVAHEYGHIVDYWICRQRFGAGSGQNFRSEYAKMRGHKTGPYYGPGQWHANTGELVANDFRILLCGAETEFWPHPGIPRPEGAPPGRRLVAGRESGARGMMLAEAWRPNRYYPTGGRVRWHGYYSP